MLSFTNRPKTFCVVLYPTLFASLFLTISYLNKHLFREREPIFTLLIIITHGNSKGIPQLTH